jgi:outer membrane protein assembly factor BamB
MQRSSVAASAFVVSVALVALLAGAQSASASTAAPAGSWPMFRYDAAHTGFNPTETAISTSNVATLHTAWTATTGFQTNLNSTPAVGGGKVVVGDGNGVVWAFDAATGASLWSVDLGTAAIDTAPALASGLVFVGNCDTLFALRAADGTTAWSTTIVIQGAHGCDLTSPTVASGLVFVGSYGSKSVHAFRQDDGTLVWSGIPTGGPIESSPAVANGLVIAGSDDGSVYAYPERCSDPCSPAWTRSLGSQAIQGSPAISRGRVFVGSINGSLAALDERTGAVLWHERVGGQVIASPAVVGAAVFASGTGGDLMAFQVNDGTTIWDDPFAGGSGSVAVANGVLYISASGNVEGFDARTGHFLWDGFVVSNVSSPVVTGGHVYASLQGVSSGTLDAWALPGTGDPRG